MCRKWGVRSDFEDGWDPLHGDDALVYLEYTMGRSGLGLGAAPYGCWNDESCVLELNVLCFS